MPTACFETTADHAAIIDVDIAVQAAGWNRLENIEGAITCACAQLAQTAEIAATKQYIEKPAAITVVLSDDQEVQRLNAVHRRIDKPTNVLSFPAPADTVHPADTGAVYLGDIVLALETVGREAHEEGRAVEDHVSHLVIHGLLHLLGYDHDTDTAADEMENLEILLLSRLGIKNPYAGQDIQDQ